MVTQTYDVKFQFGDYYFQVGKASARDVDLWQRSFKQQLTFDVITDTVTYTVNPRHLIYVQVQKSLPF